MEFLSVSGIYSITNLVNGKLYIGSAVDLKRRFSDHRRQLRGNYHPVVYLQRSWNKYGESNFKFQVIEYCSPSRCIEREQYWLNKIKSYLFVIGYNRSPSAGNCFGFKHSAKTREKMSVRMEGKPMQEEVKEKIRRALKGKKKSKSHRKNLWKNRKGWKHSEESKKKISDSLQRAVEEGRSPGVKIGWKHSEEDCKKISLGLKGKGKSEEHKRNIAEALKAYFRRKLDESRRSHEVAE